VIEEKREKYNQIERSPTEYTDDSKPPERKENQHPFFEQSTANKEKLALSGRTKGKVE